MLSICVFMYPRPPPFNNFQMSEPIFMKLGMHTMALEPIPTAYFINHSHRSLCLHVYPPIIARQRLGINVTSGTNTYAKIQFIVGRLVFYAVRVALRESMQLYLPRTSCFSASLLTATMKYNKNCLN
jgi:hypothetical protein